MARRVAWILETDGYDTTVAPPPGSATALVESRYDAVIVNSDSPQSEKRRVIQEVRERTGGARVIDIHSAALMHMRHVHASGADAYIHMPFDAATLLEELDRLLSSGQNHHAS